MSDALSPRFAAAYLAELEPGLQSVELSKTEEMTAAADADRLVVTSGPRVVGGVLAGGLRELALHDMQTMLAALGDGGGRG